MLVINFTSRLLDFMELLSVVSLVELEEGIIGSSLSLTFFLGSNESKLSCFRFVPIGIILEIELGAAWPSVAFGGCGNIGNLDRT